MDKILVQAGHGIRVLDHDFRDEGAGLEVASAFKLEEITLRADDRTGAEPFEQATFRCRLSCRHKRFSLIDL
jgi:hypothetical protein